MSEPLVVFLFEETGPIAEDKRIARILREDRILPTILNTSCDVVIDCDGVELATQSFVHALISQVIQIHPDAGTARIIYRNCSEEVRAVISTVVDYSDLLDVDDNG